MPDVESTPAAASESSPTETSRSPLTNEASTVPELISPAFNNPGTNNPAPVYENQTEWEADRRKLADIAHEALNSFLKSSIHQRADLLRDTLAVSVTLLIGGATLFFTGSEHIKTPGLFFIALGVLVVGVIANLVARAEIVKHLQDVSFQIEKNYITVYGASREVLRLPSVTNIDTAYRVESDTASFPTLRKRGNYGHLISIWTIITSIAAMTLSFLFTIR